MSASLGAGGGQWRLCLNAYCRGKGEGCVAQVLLCPFPQHKSTLISCLILSGSEGSVIFDSIIEPTAIEMRSDNHIAIYFRNKDLFKKL